MTSNAKVVIDTPSVEGRFGWEKLGNDNFAVPVIFRTNDQKYCPVRIVEQEIIKKYDGLDQSVFQCLTLKSFYITPAEAKLLNTINFQHNNARYGEQFFTSKDVIINFEDVRSLSRFLNLSNELYNNPKSDACLEYLGVYKMRVDPDDPSQTLLIPYIKKAVAPPENPPKLAKFVPLKMVAPFVAATSLSSKGLVNDWDMMYMKMLNNYCQNSVQLTKETHSKIIRVDGLVYKKNHSPIIFETYRASPKS